MAGVGHNSGRQDAAEDVLNGTAQRQLKSLIERIERLEQEKAEVAESIKEVFAEAKGNGFDVKILRKVIRLRKMDPNKRQEEEALIDLYEHALGGAPVDEGQGSSVGDEDDIA